MKELIKTSDLSKIRPVFLNIGENIKRYQQIKSLFLNDSEYRIFAEPAITDTNRNKINWFREYEGNISSFSSLEGTEKALYEGMFKETVNELFRAAIKYVKSSNEYSQQEYDRLSQTIESCLEIPSYESIYVINKPNEKPNFVITDWGFISEDHNAQTGLIKKLFPLKVTPITIQVLFKDNNTPAPNEGIFVNINENKQHYLADEKGNVKINDVLFLSNFTVFQENATGGKLNSNTYFVDERKPSEPYIFKIERPVSSMQFRVLDQFQQEVKDFRIFFDYQNFTTTRNSDENGEIVLSDIPIGASVKCFQNAINETSFLKSYTCEKATQQYILTVFIAPPIPEILKSNMQFKVLNRKKEPIPNLNLVIKHSDNTFEKLTNATGNVSFEEVPMGTSVNTTVVFEGKEYNGTFLANDSLNEIIVGKRKYGCLWWLLLLPLLLLIIWFLKDNKTPLPSPIPKPIVVIDSVKVIKITVLDKTTNLPIPNAQVSFSKDTINVNKNTDTAGIASSNNFTKNSHLVIYVKKEEYGDERLELDLSSNRDTTVYLTKIDEGGQLGKRGEISINLQWDTTDDVDLHLYTPGNHHISYEDSTVVADRFIAKLDVDANRDEKTLTIEPQENIYCDFALAGTYSIKLVLFKKYSHHPVKYKVFLKIRDKEKIIKGVLDYQGQEETIKEFEILN